MRLTRYFLFAFVTGDSPHTAHRRHTASIQYLNSIYHVDATWACRAPCVSLRGHLELEGPRSPSERIVVSELWGLMDHSIPQVSRAQRDCHFHEPIDADLTVVPLQLVNDAVLLG